MACYDCYTYILIDRYSNDVLIPKLKREAIKREIRFSVTGLFFDVFTESIKGSTKFVQYALDLCETYRDDDDEPSLKGAIVSARTSVYTGYRGHDFVKMINHLQ